MNHHNEFEIVQRFPDDIGPSALANEIDLLIASIFLLPESPSSQELVPSYPSLQFAAPSNDISNTFDDVPNQLAEPLDGTTSQPVPQKGELQAPCQKKR